MSRSEPASRWPLPLLLLGFAVLAAFFVTPVLGDLGGDSAQYLLLAESLAQGNGYVDSSAPGAPLHGHYPPGFPLLLLPLVAWAGADAFLLVKMALLLLIVLGAFLAHCLLRQRGSSTQATAALAIALTVPALVLDGGRIRSESAFLPFLYASLWALDARRPWTALLLGVLATSVRLAALPLLFLPSLLAWRRSKQQACGLLLAGMAPLFGWAAYVFVAGAGGYAGEALRSAVGKDGAMGALRWGWESLTVYGEGLGTTLASQPLPAINPWVAWPLLGLVLVGLLRTFVQRRSLVEVFVVLEVLLVAFAPQREPRYLMPLLPLCAWYLLEGLRWLPGALGRHTLVAAAAALVLCHLATLAPIVGGRLKPRVVHPPAGMALVPVDMALWEDGLIQPRNPEGDAAVQAAGDLLLLCQWMRKELPEDAVLASRLHRTLALLTRRKCVPLPPGDDAASLLEGLQKSGATHLVEEARMQATQRVVERLGGRDALSTVFAVRSAACLRLPPPAEPGR